MKRYLDALKLAVVLVALPSAAQPLADFLSSADSRSLETQLGALKTQKAQLEVSQRWGALLPALSATGGWTHNQYPAVVTFPSASGAATQVTIVPRNQLDAALKVEVPLLDASRWLETAAAAKSGASAVEREHQLREDVRREVVTAYYLHLGTRALAISTARSLEAAGAQLEEERLRREAGRATDLEVLRARAEVERNRQLHVDAQSNVATSGRSLESLTGLTPRDLPPVPVDDLAPEPPVEELEGALTERPQVRAAMLDIEAASRNRTAAGLLLVPNVGAQFTQRFTNATGFQNASALWNAGLTFNWRLDLTGVQGLAAAANAEDTARTQHAQVLQQTRDRIFNDWHRVNAARVKVSAAGAQLEAARRAASLAKERYRGGVATQVDVIQADRDLLGAEVADIQARVDLASARSWLRLSSGRPLEVAR